MPPRYDRPNRESNQSNDSASYDIFDCVRLAWGKMTVQSPLEVMSWQGVSQDKVTVLHHWTV